MWIHSETRKWHDKNIQTITQAILTLLDSFTFRKTFYLEGISNHLTNNFILKKNTSLKKYLWRNFQNQLIKNCILYLLKRGILNLFLLVLVNNIFKFLLAIVFHFCIYSLILLFLRSTLTGLVWLTATPKITSFTLQAKLPFQTILS